MRDLSDLRSPLVFLVLALVLAVLASLGQGASAPSGDPATAEFLAETFETRRERMDEDYPYLELCGVDWQAEREGHRPKAVAAADENAFALEPARFLSWLPDPHLALLPALERVGPT